MAWSIKKLDEFYNTSLGQKTKYTIQKEISKLIAKNKILTQNIHYFGYNIMNPECQQNKMQMFDAIVSIHCEETGHAFNELLELCKIRLKNGGYCILVTSNGNGEWSERKQPFSKYRSYKNIKAIQRLNFKIIKKKPILCFPIIPNFLTNLIYRFYRFCFTSRSGAYLLMAQKSFEYSYDNNEDNKRDKGHMF